MAWRMARQMARRLTWRRRPEARRRTWKSLTSIGLGRFLHKDAQESKAEDKVIYDGAGNKVEVKKALSEKDAKKAIKDLEAKLKKQVKTKTMTDEEL